MFSPSSPDSFGALFANADNYGCGSIADSLSQDNLKSPTATTPTLNPSVYCGVPSGLCEDFPELFGPWNPPEGTLDGYQDLAIPEPQSTSNSASKSSANPSEDFKSVKRSKRPDTRNGDMFRISKRRNRDSTKRAQHETSDSHLRFNLHRRENTTREDGRMSQAAIAGCHHWLQSHPGIIPGDVEMVGLHLAYHAPLGSVHQWFRNLQQSQKTVNRSSGSPPISGSTLTQPYRQNRKICFRKGQPSNGPLVCPNKDPSKPYNCSEHFRDWKDRIDHVAKELETDWIPSDWRDIDVSDHTVEREDTQSVSSNDSRSESGSHSTSESTDSDSNDDDDNNDNHGLEEDPGTNSGSGTGEDPDLEPNYGNGTQTRNNGNHQGMVQYHGQSYSLGKNELSSAAKPEVTVAIPQSESSSTNISVAFLDSQLQRFLSYSPLLQQYISCPQAFEQVALGMPIKRQEATKRLLGSLGSRRLLPSTHTKLALPLRARYNPPFSNQS
ncbi:hypothetical protein MMC26_003641 [Xylographa opegraphella]|nr:hypothetical protein [Xylographa opegraphella]